MVRRILAKLAVCEVAPTEMTRGGTQSPSNRSSVQGLP